MDDSSFERLVNIQAYSDDELKTLAAALAEEETDVSKRRRLLHAQISEQPELMDSSLLADLQTLLQTRARADGVDVSLHTQWAGWLNDAPS